MKVRMEDMTVSGDILHEDYQRDMHLSLTGTTLTGKITGKTAEEWNALCREKGFESYLIDPDGYKTIHGVRLALESGSLWNVAGDSTLTSLSIGEGAKIAAPAGRTLRMTVDGVETSIKAGTFAGDIEIKVE